MKTRCIASSLRHPLLTINKVVKGFYIMLLEIGAEMHVRSDTKVLSVLLLNRPHVSIIAFIAK